MRKQQKYLQRLTKIAHRQPVWAGITALLLIVVVGGVVFVPRFTAEQNAQVREASSSSANPGITVDGAVTTITGTTPIESPAPPTEPEPDLETSAHASSHNTAYTPKCRGAGCVTANPSYSIITDGAITVTAGSTAGPYTARTSTGAVVDWSTPQFNGPGVGPYGYTNSNLRKTSSSQYYIRAESNIAPGTYTLYLSAIEGSSETLVRTAIAVTVVTSSALDEYGMPIR